MHFYIYDDSSLYWWRCEPNKLLTCMHMSTCAIILTYLRGNNLLKERKTNYAIEKEN